MITWFQHLTWSHAALCLILIGMGVYLLKFGMFIGRVIRFGNALDATWEHAARHRLPPPSKDCRRHDVEAVP